MPESLVGDDAITVVAPDLFSLEKATLDEIEHDPLHGALGDPDLLGHFSHDDFRLLVK